MNVLQVMFVMVFKAGHYMSPRPAVSLKSILLGPCFSFNVV